MAVYGMSEANPNIQQRLAKRMAASPTGVGPRPLPRAPMGEVANPGTGYAGAQAFGRQVAGQKPAAPAYAGAQAFGRQVAGAGPMQAQPEGWSPGAPGALGWSPGAPGALASRRQPRPMVPQFASQTPIGQQIGESPTGPRPTTQAPLYPGSTATAQRAVAGGARIPPALLKRYYGI